MVQWVEGGGFSPFLLRVPSMGVTLLVFFLVTARGRGGFAGVLVPSEGGPVPAHRALIELRGIAARDREDGREHAVAPAQLDVEAVGELDRRAAGAAARVGRRVRVARIRPGLRVVDLAAAVLLHRAR